MKQILKDLPQDPIDFMMNWIKENHGNRASAAKNERIKLDQLREEAEKLRTRKTELMQELGIEEDHGSDGEGAEDEKPGSEM